MIGLNHLPHQQKDEEVIFTLRRDKSILIFIIMWYVLLMLAPFAVYAFIENFFSFLLQEPLRTILILIAIGYYMYILLFFYRAFLDYYLDIWIVTNHRVLNIEQEGLFKRTVAEVKLFRIQDVATEQQGFLATFLRYGDVYVQSAGTKQRVVLEQVPHPDKVARQIVQLVAWYKKAYPEEY